MVSHNKSRVSKLMMLLALLTVLLVIGLNNSLIRKPSSIDTFGNEDPTLLAIRTHRYLKLLQKKLKPNLSNYMDISSGVGEFAEYLTKYSIHTPSFNFCIVNEYRHFQIDQTEYKDCIEYNAISRKIDVRTIYGPHVAIKVNQGSPVITKWLADVDQPGGFVFCLETGKVRLNLPIVNSLGHPNQQPLLDFLPNDNRDLQYYYSKLPGEVKKSPVLW